MLSLTAISALGRFLTDAQHWLIAVLGIGLVVFVHELGHFIVAKRCKVRVEIFSLGFGPRLFGWIRGDTDYRVSLIPIGGYVKMAGDNPGEELEGDDSEFPSKSVGQRFAIFSAGVAMNLLFAIVVLPVVLTLGVQFNSTVIGRLSPGSPAWKSGMLADDEVIRVSGNPVYDFNNIVAEVAVGARDGVVFDVRRTQPDGSRKDLAISVLPEFDETVGYRVCGLLPGITLERVEDGLAAQAGMNADEHVVAIDGKPMKSFSDFEGFVMENRDASVSLELESVGGSRRTIELRPAPGPNEMKIIGIRPIFNRVIGVRGAAEQLGLFEVGDELLELVATGSDSGNATILRIRGEEDFRDALRKAAAAPQRLQLRVRRGTQVVLLPIPPALDETLVGDIALSNNADSTTVQTLAGYPAEAAGLPNDCTILKVGERPVNSWSAIRSAIEDSEDRIRLAYTHDGVQSEIEIAPRLERRATDYGLLPVLSKVSRQFAAGEAVKVGMRYAVYMLKHVYLTLKRIFARDVSPRNLSGIITIAYVSRSLAESGISSLLFFLAVLSLNLAFVNLLPIPILDGGHLLFLLVEKIKGSPVSERVMSYSQMIGLVMVLALLLYVTYNDLVRVLS